MSQYKIIKLTVVMKGKGMTQGELAQKVGVSQARISHICTGIAGDLSEELVNNIAKALDWSDDPWDLLKEVLV